MQLPLTGGCVCGAIRYTVSRVPVNVYTCHCTDCQRITGSAFSIGVVVTAQAFQLTGNEPRPAPGGITVTGRVKTRWICPDCATTLYGGPKVGSEAPGAMRVIRGGTLDDTSWLQPSAHLWTRSAQPWIVLPEGIRRFATQPDNLAQAMSSGSGRGGTAAS